MELEAPPIVAEGTPMPESRTIGDGVRAWRGCVYRWHRQTRIWLRCDDEPLPSVEPAPHPERLRVGDGATGWPDLPPLAAMPTAAPTAFRDPHTGERVEWDGRRLLWPNGDMLHLPDRLPREDRLGRFWSVVGCVAQVTDIVSWNLARALD